MDADNINKMYEDMIYKDFTTAAVSNTSDMPMIPIQTFYDPITTQFRALTAEEYDNMTKGEQETERRLSAIEEKKRQEDFDYKEKHGGEILTKEAKENWLRQQEEVKQQYFTGTDAFTISPRKARFSIEPPSKEELLFAPHSSNNRNEELQESSYGRYGVEQLKIMYDKFFETGNEVYLYRMLVKSGIINRLCNCCGSDIGRLHNEEEVNEYLRTKVPNEVRRIVKDLNLYKIEVSSKARKSISHMVEKLYITPTRNMYHTHISSSDEYNDILERFISRGVNIDDDLRVPIDFREMLIANEHLTVFYTGVCNELTLVECRSSGMSPRSRTSYFDQLFSNLPDVPNKTTEEVELININGVNYSKKAFESIIELDVNSLLANLNIESRIHEESKHEEESDQEIKFL